MNSRDCQEITLQAFANTPALNATVSTYRGATTVLAFGYETALTFAGTV